MSWAGLWPPGRTYPWLYRYSVPFQAPCGHWMRYVAPSGSDPVVVVTALPPQIAVGAATAVLAVSPAAARPPASASPAIFPDRAIFLARTMNPRSRRPLNDLPDGK